MYPKVLCARCYTVVYRRLEGSRQRSITVHDYSSDVPVVTRRSKVKTDHSCKLCEVARSNPLSKPIKNVKKSSQTRLRSSNKQNSIKVCPKCLTVIKKGKSNKCCKQTKMQNLARMAGEDADKLLARSLRTERSAKNGLLLNNIRGRATKVKILKGKMVSQDKQRVPVEQMLRIKTKLDLSTRKIIKLAQALWVSSVAIQPGLSGALTSSAHELEEFFDIEKNSFIKSNGRVITHADQWLVYCRSVPGLIEYIKGHRNIDDVRFVVGIDGGQGSLNIILTIEDKQESLEQSEYKNTGVKRCLILVLVEDVQENYENVAKIWTKLELGLLDAVVTGDLKIVNIISGVMSNSYTFPCAFCTVNKKDLGLKFGVLRTIGSVKRSSALWTVGGSNKVNAKDYFNCVHIPLVHGKEDTLVLDVCSPPSLHLVLGMVNAVFNSVAEHDPNLSHAWALASSATRHAQFGFTGRHCRSLLKNRDLLANKDLLRKQVLDTLQQMIDACFGDRLEKHYEQCIVGFCNARKLAKLTLTPKLHIIQQHVAEFCHNKQSGLANYSEQTTESVHRDFRKKWEDYKVPKTSTAFPRKLLSCVVAYNSLHIV